MSIRLQHLREAWSFLSTFTGKVGELAVDTTNNRLCVHDGVTAGGWPVAKLAEVVTNSRTAVADAAYTALATDRTIAYTAITAARTVTLPAAASYPTGTMLTVVDESGSCSATNSITLSRAGSDLINGAASAVISSAYGFLALESNGTNKWTLVDRANSNLPSVGIGTAADPNNVLSVYGTSALFNSAGNFNFTINKAASTNTASTIYEDGFSGRAQVGLCGDDNFHFKVSPNGSTWYDALDINASTGYVGIGTENPLAPLEVCVNTGAPVPPAGAIAYFVNADGSNTFLGMAAYGTNVHSDLLFQTARGTGASPSAVQSGDNLGQIQWRGYGATSFSPTKRAGLEGVAAENWSDTAQGTYFSLFATATGTTTVTELLRIAGNGQIIYFGAQADQSKSDQTPTTGFSITIGNSTTTLLLKPSGPLASGTITLPAAPVDGQIARVLSSQTVTSLSVSPSTGQAIIGAPATITTTTPFAMIYDLASTTWYRMP